jgi:ABC-type anion transport system duplicated permease subunit
MSILLKIFIGICCALAFLIFAGKYNQVFGGLYHLFRCIGDRMIEAYYLKFLALMKD